MSGPPGSGPLARSGARSYCWTMTDASFVREGGCRCGEVRVRVSAPPIMTSACHCTGCQRMSSSAYSLSAMFPSASFAVTRGTPVLGGLRKGTHHMFCASCKSWMFTRPEGMDAFVNLRTTMLDDTSGLEPFVETYISEKLAWTKPTAERTYDTFPDEAAYPELLAAYAAYRAAREIP